MNKRTLLNINFSSEENILIENALKKTNVDVNVISATLNKSGSLKEKVGLVVIKLNGDLRTNKSVLRQVKNEFVHSPIILVSNAELGNDEASQYDLDNVIDIRPLNPLFLVIKSITREIKSQQKKHLFHQIKSQFKNASYRFDAFLKHTEDGVALIHNGQYWSTNDAYKRIFNIPNGEYLINTPVLEFTTPTSCQTVGHLPKENLNTSLESLPDETILPVLIQTRNNESFITTIYKTQCFVKDALCTQLLVHNPDAWRSVDKDYTDLRSFDHDTGLYNKRFAREYIDKELQTIEPHGSLAIILIDEFRHIRDQYSIDYIDEIMYSVAPVIKKSGSKNDVLARHGDLAFSLFSCELDRSDFLLNCQKILTEVNNTLFDNDSQYIKLSLSIGVSFINEATTGSIELVSQANKACDKASAQAGNQIHVFDSITTQLTLIID
jgi:diguanylate cyclase (GGDEF)-like protein